MSETTDKFIEWVDALPPTWRAKRLGSLASVKARLGWKGLKAEEYVDEGYIFLSTPNLKGDEIDFENVNYITKARYDESPEIMLRVGDVLMVKDGATLGIVALVKNLPAPATLNGSTAVIRTTGECDSRFLCHWLRSKGVQQLIEKMKGGMGVPHLFQSDLRRFPVALPPPAEQRRIAGYLDEATGKVDRLVALRRRQMELLREQRAVLIQQAVTRGLNPNTPLKDSGLPWLGQIPKHWQMKRLKFLARFKSGDGITSDEIADTGKYPVFGGNGVRGYASVFTHEGHFVLIGRQGALCGNINYAEGRFWASEHAVVATLAPGNEVYWFGEILRVMNLNQYSQSAAQPGLAVEKVQNLLTCVPPQAEQRAIVEFIQSESGKNDRLLSAYTRQLELLTEYRAALLQYIV